ncbi:MAG: hypothetical protein UHU21_07505 [Lachnospiraceae bacterium]|nr:hypothetical protein [Lachnospiraceae bacterium]
MKYLIKHQKEFIITIGVFATIAVVLAWVVYSAVNGTLDYKQIVAIIGVIFEALGWFYNMPTSEENTEATLEMRLRKLKNELEYDYFEEDPDEQESGDNDE